MAKTKISEFSSTPANNTDIDSINIAENCPPSGINDAIRELMAQLKDFQTGAAGDSFNGPVGTTTAAAGAFTTLTASSTATLNTLASSGATLTGGSINNMTIGGTTAAAVSATTLTTSGAVTLNGGTANGVAYLNGSKVLTTGSALTFDGSSFGVGTASPSEKMEVYGGGFSVNSGTIKAVLSYSGGASVFGTTTNSDLAFLRNNSEQMRLTSTGLGIGTSSPATKLDVVGEALIQGRLQVTSATPEVLFSVPSGGLDSRIFNDGSGNLVFGTGTNSSTPTERLRIDSSGNLGIGTSSPQTKLQANGTSAGSLLDVATVRNGSSVANSEVGIFFNPTDQTTNIRGARIAAFNDGGNNIGLKFYTGAGASITSKMLLDSSGNLGLGVTPSAWAAGIAALEMKDGSVLAAAGTSINYACNAYYDTAWRYKVSGAASYFRQLNGAYQFFTAPSGTAGNAISFTQALTLDASGNLLVGRTGASNTPDSGLSLNTGSNAVGSSAIAIGHVNGSASGDKYAWFNYNGTTIGSITQSGTTATAYNTSSDYRLKDITGPITTSGAYIDSLNPVEGTWKADGSTFVGLIAHEVQEASRTQVATGVKDGEQMQGMDYSSAEIIANLIAELQSVRKRLAVLEAA